MEEPTTSQPDPQPSEEDLARILVMMWGPGVTRSAIDAVVAALPTLVAPPPRCAPPPSRPTRK